MADGLTPGFLWQVAVTLIGAGAIYGGIRVDLQRTREIADGARSSARRAHSRLDAHLAHHAGHPVAQVRESDEGE